MDNKTGAGADNAWQSIRLILGAILLIGLGVMLGDGTIHPSAAFSSVFVSQNLFSQSK